MSLDQFANDDFCYLSTQGRTSGRTHTIEIWFALEGHVLYMLSGGGAGTDWVKNLLQTPAVQVRLRDTVYAGQARIVERAEEDALARRIVVAKYQPSNNGDLGDWGHTALPIAVDLVE